ncbi:carbohydrate ABC transporter membrane protein 2, CUT1 family [Actinacidiphila yanglinensis]|uniref:Carbohydrate ABC transporter membrane protein 2, CUT1 family n=1 Tax=Actinacidiphila yanglinensis TaxID=310779 RepID=A0A1H5ZWM0_9ACTN|nr:carbohydrate ABC transporter permease [Actinacidiphila yanglinensis]SEG40560.1 carbohydrate ABC transporter membrane protein 2, CUT1 family [Actinacidiphila yanglinensis]
MSIVRGTTRGTADRAARRRPRRSATTALLLGVTVLLGVVYVLPFVIQLVTSFKTDPDAASHPLSLLPNPFTLDSYRRLFGLGGSGESVPFMRWLGNSVLVTVFVTVGRVFFDSLAGYALARLDFRGRNLLFNGLLTVMSVPGVVLLIPKFLVLNELGMFDTYAGMIVPLLVDAAGVFVMRQFFLSVPKEVEEAARIDGAGIFRTFWSVVLPMARPALITLTILSFQSSWNEFTHFLVATQSPQYETLTTGLARFVSGSLSAGTQYPLKLTAALVATIPVAVLFFVFQRHFVRGANSGSVKG